MESKSLGAEDLGRRQLLVLPVKILCIAVIITLMSLGYLANADAFASPTAKPGSISPDGKIWNLV